MASQALRHIISKQLGIAIPPGRSNRRDRRKPSRKYDRPQQKRRQESSVSTALHHDTSAVVSRPPINKQIAEAASRKRKREIASQGEDEDEEDEESDADRIRLSEPSSESDDDDNGRGPGNSLKNSRLKESSRVELAKEDARIKILERKLGIIRRKQSTPKLSKDDGLDDLLSDLEDSEDSQPDGTTSFQKWLTEKRAARVTDENVTDLQAVDDHSQDSDDNIDGSSSDGLESNLGITNRNSPRRRENPYVPPVTKDSATYVPPFQRQSLPSVDDDGGRLQKQLKGQVNRLTDANILSIVARVEDIYQKNIRSDVTASLVDIVMAQVQKPETLPDPFFVLIAGFVAAIYKITGPHFGSHMLSRLVGEFDEEHKLRRGQTADGVWKKETSNLITFIAALFVFDVVGHKLIFDYVNLLLQDFTELNAELLLRIIRMSGRVLRKNHPDSLRDTVTSLNKAVATVGPDGLSSRTRFMVEALNSLKANKTKALGGDSLVISEHVVRMKKRLGELKSQSWRRLDSTNAMGMGLKDLMAGDTSGKWWLIGASVQRPSEHTRTETASGDPEQLSPGDDEDMELILPDYSKRAREQGLTTNAQSAIFVAIMSAPDPDQGYRQYMMLKLKSDDRREVVRVLIQCVGSEATYNPYYHLVAKQACSSSKIRFAFQDRLWNIVRALGEPLFEEALSDGDDEEINQFKDMRRLTNIGQLYGLLAADSTLSIAALLRPLDLTRLRKRTTTLVGSILVSILRASFRSSAEESRSALKLVLEPVGRQTSLVAGLEIFFRKVVKVSGAWSDQDEDGLEEIRLMALNVLDSVIV